MPRLPCPAAVVAGIAVGAGAAHAGPWRVQVEGGGEIDTNVQRVETGPELETDPVTAPVVRLGGKVERSGRDGRNAGGFALSFASRTSLDRGITTEDTALLGADGRILRTLAGGAAIGIRGVYTDALPLSGVTGTRTFRSLLGEGLVILRGDAGDAITIAAGGRTLTYKPDHDFDWRGPTAAIRFDRTLWHNADDTRTVELTADYRLERRAYDGAAFVNRCAPDADPSPMCFAPTMTARADLYHAASIEATYTGDLVLSAGYQLTYVDSNSYGQSLVRHRVSLSATHELPLGFIGTATVTGQLDQYLDTLILARDVQSQSFTALDDDNRSSLQLRAARPLSTRISLEGRAAYWTDLSGPADVDFRRLLLYAGLVWATD
jgi:hypothetical protein